MKLCCNLYWWWLLNVSLWQWSCCIELMVTVECVTVTMKLYFIDGDCWMCHCDNEVVVFYWWWLLNVSLWQWSCCIVLTVTVECVTVTMKLLYCIDRDCWMCHCDNEVVLYWWWLLNVSLWQWSCCVLLTVTVECVTVTMKLLYCIDRDCWMCHCDNEVVVLYWPWLLNVSLGQWSCTLLMVTVECVTVTMKLLYCIDGDCWTCHCDNEVVVLYWPWLLNVSLWQWSCCVVLMVTVECVTVTMKLLYCIDGDCWMCHCDNEIVVLCWQWLLNVSLWQWSCCIVLTVTVECVTVTMKLSYCVDSDCWMCHCDNEVVVLAVIVERVTVTLKLWYCIDGDCWMCHCDNEVVVLYWRWLLNVSLWQWSCIVLTVTVECVAVTMKLLYCIDGDCWMCHCDNEVVVLYWRWLLNVSLWQWSCTLLMVTVECVTVTMKLLYCIDGDCWTCHCDNEVVVLYWPWLLNVSLWQWSCCVVLMVTVECVTVTMKLLYCIDGDCWMCHCDNEIVVLCWQWLLNVSLWQWSCRIVLTVTVECVTVTMKLLYWRWLLNVSLWHWSCYIVLTATVECVTVTMKLLYCIDGDCWMCRCDNEVVLYWRWLLNVSLWQWSCCIVLTVTVECVTVTMKLLYCIDGDFWMCHCDNEVVVLYWWWLLNVSLWQWSCIVLTVTVECVAVTMKLLYCIDGDCWMCHCDNEVVVLYWRWLLNVSLWQWSCCIVLMVTFECVTVTMKLCCIDGDCWMCRCYNEVELYWWWLLNVSLWQWSCVVLMVTVECVTVTMKLLYCIDGDCWMCHCDNEVVVLYWWWLLNVSLWQWSCCIVLMVTFECVTLTMKLYCIDGDCWMCRCDNEVVVLYWRWLLNVSLWQWSCCIVLTVTVECVTVTMKLLYCIDGDFWMCHCDNEVVVLYWWWLLNVSLWQWSCCIVLTVTVECVTVTMKLLYCIDGDFWMCHCDNEVVVLYWWWLLNVSLWQWSCCIVLTVTVECVTVTMKLLYCIDGDFWMCHCDNEVVVLYWWWLLNVSLWQWSCCIVLTVTVECVTVTMKLLYCIDGDFWMCHCDNEVVVLYWWWLLNVSLWQWSCCIVLTVTVECVTVTMKLLYCIDGDFWMCHCDNEVVVLYWWWLLNVSLLQWSWIVLMVTVECVTVTMKLCCIDGDCWMCHCDNEVVLYWWWLLNVSLWQWSCCSILTVTVECVTVTMKLNCIDGDCWMCHCDNEVVVLYWWWLLKVSLWQWSCIVLTVTVECVTVTDAGRSQTGVVCQHLPPLPGRWGDAVLPHPPLLSLLRRAAAVPHNHCTFQSHPAGTHPCHCSRYGRPRQL